MSKRILVVDDDAAIRDSLRLTLERAGYRATTVDGGEKAIDAFRTDQFDLVLLDLKMPEMDGIETLRALRKLDAEVPIYIVTAFHEEYFDRLSALTEAQISFQLMMKPLDGDQVRTLVREILTDEVGPD